MRPKRRNEPTPNQELTALAIRVLLLVAAALIIGGVVYGQLPALW